MTSRHENDRRSTPMTDCGLTHAILGGPAGGRGTETSTVGCIHRNADSGACRDDDDDQ